MATPSWKDLLSSFDTKTSPSSVISPDVNGEEQQLEVGNLSDVSVIYTDTSILAKKFMINRDSVIGALNAYISAEQTRGEYWLLLDVAGYRTFRKTGWESYVNLLNDFFQERGIISDINTSVFIIGGEDVIPIPKYRVQLDGASIGFEVEMDLFYCFKPGVDVTTFLNKVKLAGPDGIESALDNIHCNVGRLPVETGTQTLSFEESIVSYLKRCSDADMCIRVDNSMNVSVDEWAEATGFIVNGIPSTTQGLDAPCVNDDMFIVPDFNICQQAMRALFEVASQQADMAVFNLHGDKLSQRDCYYGNNKAEAFSPDLAEKCNAKLICSLACYGARYAGYAKNRSILLSAIWNNCLLFIGSCQPSFFSLKRRGYCEILIKEFLLNLFKGIPSGAALLLAKISYLLKYWAMDNFNSAYLTIAEFNVFGNPRIYITTDAVNIEQYEYDTISALSQSQYGQESLSYDGSAESDVDEGFIEILEGMKESTTDIKNQLLNKLNSDFSMENVKLCGVLKRETSNSLSGYKFK